uniref:Uncharacterized protein n=1 Tax=Oryza barthii TaxID=65489 RepID=A0A0D3FSL9_9ORYZ
MGRRYRHHGSHRSKTAVFGNNDSEDLVEKLRPSQRSMPSKPRLPYCWLSLPLPTVAGFPSPFGNDLDKDWSCSFNNDQIGVSWPSYPTSHERPPLVAAYHGSGRRSSISQMGRFARTSSLGGRQDVGGGEVGPLGGSPSSP